ncbi:hypothetical protein PA598K_02861 [Paenibacillus sp. 598K]|uniref:hypothetical protein n=1 Tax=Paenibacillus sp. 598K TaxID=1117987 RepID=UPI000FF97E53|nr:hypothetical protein [Paenibacillus sp. 598K]GBF74513.1 hypothetical protein PA598K_02861 [Paenibacillus sp. 598K]
MNNDYFERLYTTVGDLLYRVRIYDRDLMNTDEIIAMDETYEKIQVNKWMMGSPQWQERAIEKLENMNYRLVTIMEDLLYTA